MKAIVKAVCKNGNTPLNFPWSNGVSVNLTLRNEGDTLEAFLNGLEDIKQMINKDANRHGLALRDLNITLDI